MKTQGPADLVIFNASIISDGLNKPANLAAVADGRFNYVGEFDGALIGPDTRQIDAQGRTVIPGLIDSHLHMLWGGVNLNSGVDLRPARSRREFIEIIQNHITSKKLAPSQWITGGRWATESWVHPDEPTRHWIDNITAKNPTLLSRMDGHSALANSAALQLANISAQSPDPPGGRIERNPETGEPTGILRESAIGLVRKFRPKPTLDEQIAGCRSAAKLALTHGITSVGDIVESNTLEAYQDLANSDPADHPDETVRIFMYVSDHHWEQLIPDIQQFQSKPNWVQIAGLKDYIDGSLGSKTAAMHEPYLPRKNSADSSESNFGLFMDGIREGRLKKNLEIARDSNLQPIYHAIGDEATHVLLETLQEIIPNQDQRRALRPRIEHAQHLLAEDLSRIATLGIIASMQPYHKFDDARTMAKYLGEKRCANSYMFRSLLEENIPIAFGSDWPIVTMNPFSAIETAVNNTTALGRSWHPDESITIKQALRCYTTFPAFALHAENEIGRIAPGYRADFVILNHSPFDEKFESFEEIHPLLTALEGRVVFES